MVKPRGKKASTDSNKLYNPDAKYYEKQGSADTSNKVTENKQMNRKNR
ncbi:hypothetical protein [Virgibacillus sp. DJP39]